MEEFVGGAALQVGKCIAEPIKRQFNYLCCFNTNIQNLRGEAEKLNDAKVGVEGQVDAARRNVQVILPRVETWLDDVRKIEADMSAIKTEIQNVKSGCLAIKSRFSLSRKATKMAAAMKKIKDDGKFEQISMPALPASFTSIPHGQTYEVESRKHFEEEIMATLREKKVSMMGICGMGGVGKTTMAKKIMSRARGESLFDEIVMVVVSQPVDMLRIQKEMAELLGLKLEVESLAARAHQLRIRLTNTKKILIILDDLWEALSLEELGIPECTILLTSRNTDVLSDMSVEKPYQFQMKILSEIEAWSLFKEKVGACANDQSLFPAAKDIVRECNGLPIALVVVGAALKDKKNKAIWENEVHALTSCNPEGISNFLPRVYNTLKLSIDLLDNGHARLMFLLCCLFPEDHNILISDLCLYTWGLDMFDRIPGLRDARNKVQASVETLKSRYLLMDGFDDGSVKMHDVVRDVGIFTAEKEGLMSPSWPRRKSNYPWISLFDAQKITLPEDSAFSKLRLLLMEVLRLRPGEELPLGDNFFKSATKLHVLSIRKYTLRSLPRTIQLQKDLRTLMLISCSSLEDISVVGELVSLEILYCQWCDGIKEIPVEIGRLDQLKLLDISYCWNLETIAAGVISRLIRLEELTLIGSFTKWESGALCELNHLSFLTTLRIQIQDASLAAEQIHLPNLVEFRMLIGWPKGRLTRIDTKLSLKGREMSLKLERDEIIGDWIYQLLRTTQRLNLCGQGSSKLVPLLPENLQEMNLRRLPKLQHLFNVVPRFCELSSVYIVHCHSLRSVFPYATGSDYLKSLRIQSCSTLEQVVIWKEEESSCIPFARLENLLLDNLPMLKTLCKGMKSIQFPLLTRMVIRKCPNLKSLLSSGAGNDADESLHLFCKSEAKMARLSDGTTTVFPLLEFLSLENIDDLEEIHKGPISSDSFNNLKKVTLERLPKLQHLWNVVPLFYNLSSVDIVHCHNLRSVFPYATGNDYLSQLKSLRIQSCSILEQVVIWKEEESSCNHHRRRIPFARLENLLLDDLPRLKTLCKGIDSTEFPLLTRMRIVKCPTLKSVVSSTENDDDSLHLFCKPDQAAFGRLEKLAIGGCGSTISLWCDRIPIDLFTGLVDLTVCNCDNIMSLFSLSIARNLVNLKGIEIRSCLMLEQVVLLNEEENGKDINKQSSRNLGRITFPKLKKLILDDLPRLTSFCKGIQSIEFPLLTEMGIKKCTNLKSLVSSSTENDHICSGAVNDADESFHFLCKSEGAFGRLEYLEINGYEKISSLWCNQISVDLFTRLVQLHVCNCGNIKSLLIAGNLVNLKYLIIERCREMVNVVEVERSSFIKLEMLRLIKLPKLKAFCDWRCALHLPSLTTVYIYECPEMERFSFGSLTTPNLNSITINTKHIEDYTLDLNEALFWDRGSLHLEILFASDE